MAFIWKEDDKSKNPRNVYRKWEGNVGFSDAVVGAFRRVFDYSGFSTRSEFWWFVLFSVGINAISYPVSRRIIQILAGQDDEIGIVIVSTFVSAIIFLALFLVWFPLAIRRIRDAGKSPVWMTLYILVILPLFGTQFTKSEYSDYYIVSCSIFSLFIFLIMTFIYLMPTKGKLSAS